VATQRQSKPRLRVEVLQQAIAYCYEGHGHLVPDVYLHFIAGLVDGALSRRKPRVA
jgi:hypothetical protein